MRVGGESLDSQCGEVARRRAAFPPCDKPRVTLRNSGSVSLATKYFPAPGRADAEPLDTVCRACPGTCPLPDSELAGSYLCFKLSLQSLMLSSYQEAVSLLPGKV